MDVQLIKRLQDKQYEKRKLAAVDLEKLQLDYSKSKDVVDQFLSWLNPNCPTHQKSGACLALVSCSYSMEIPSTDILEWNHVIMQCFDDLDPKMRYYSCEALYNLIKHTKTCILHTTIDNIAKLASDPDKTCRQAAELLDRLLKDIILDVEINYKQIMPILSERMHAIHPNVRTMMLNWLHVLSSLPNANFMQDLPLILSTLFKYLSDDHEEIRSLTLSFLNLMNPLVQQQDVSVLLPLLLPFIQTEDELTTCTALNWLSTFMKYPDELSPHLTLLIDVLLSIPLSNTILPHFHHVNDQLHKLIQSCTSQTQMQGILNSIYKHLSDSKLISLDYIKMIYINSDLQVQDPIKSQLFQLLRSDDEVICKKVMKLTAELSVKNFPFHSFIQHVLALFSVDRSLLQNKGAYILTTYGQYVGMSTFLKGLSVQLAEEDDLEMCQTMVQNLNLILLTHPSCQATRMTLNTMQQSDLFLVLYKAWAHHPVCLFSLCLLCQLYEHACDVLVIMSEYEITVNMLIQLDKLVQLLESPIFTFLRVQLLEMNPYLFRALYGILMILPQSSAFGTLKSRLGCINPLLMQTNANQPQISKRKTKRAEEGIDFNELLEVFKAIQSKHHQHRISMLEKNQQ
eukprot:NODE_407_length_7978_cov_0.670009.p2 type:complete len:626 gc:universal NODE_407_length_7978_cov_0.670009:3402-1525(-)